MVPQSRSWTHTEEPEAEAPRRYGYQVRSSFLHTSQVVEAAPVSTEGRMDTRSAISTHNGVVVSLNEEGESNTC